MRTFPLMALLITACLAAPLSAAVSWTLPYEEPPATTSGTIYDIGPGKPYGELSQVPWLSLGAGDLVRIHYRATPYVGLIGLKPAGTESAPLRIYGVRDSSTGAVPVLSANGAVGNANSVLGVHTRGLGLIMIYGGWSPLPTHITIANLEIRDATAGSTYSDQFGTGTFGNFSCGIWARAKHLTVRGCRFVNDGLGIFTQSNDDDNSRVSEDILLDGCDFSGNGAVGSYTEHNIYTQGIDVTIQHCRIARLRPGAWGSALKDRSAGTVIRYNLIDAAARAIDLVEPEDSPAVVALPTYGVDYVYGNVITNDPDNGGSGRMIHYGADNSPEVARKRTLSFYNNSISMFKGGNPSWPGRVDIFQVTDAAGVIACRNNIISMQVPPGSDPAWIPAFMNLLVDDIGTIDLRGGNWLSSHWTEYLYGNASVGDVLRTVTPVTGVDPGFVDGQGGDLRLNGGSSARSIAVALPGAITAVHPVLFQAGSPAVARTSFLDAGPYEVDSGSAEIVAMRGASTIADGSTDTVTGTVSGALASLTYAISNLGGATLTLGSIGAITGTNCTVTVATAPSASVAASGSTSLVLSVTPTAAGPWSFPVSFTTNDSDENPTNWTVSGVADPAPTPTPAIAVSRGGVTIAHATTDSVSGTTAGSAITLTYAIQNTGSASVQIGTLGPISGSNCSVVIATAPAGTVAAGASTSLVLTVTPTIAGSWSSNVTIHGPDINDVLIAWTVAGNAATGSGSGSGSSSGQGGSGGGGCGLGAIAGLLLSCALTFRRRQAFVRSNLPPVNPAKT